MTKNGYDIVNIIQTSTIFTFPDSGKDCAIPIKLKQIYLLYFLFTNKAKFLMSNLQSCQNQKESCVDLNDHFKKGATEGCRHLTDKKQHSSW